LLGVSLNEPADTTNTADDDTNTTDSTVDSTTDTTNGTSEDTNITNETNTIDTTDDTTTDTTNTTTDTTDDTNTTDTVDTTAETVDDTATDTTNTTDDTDVENTTTEVTDSIDSTGDTVENTTDTATALDGGDTTAKDATESTDTDVTEAVTEVGGAVSDVTTELDGTTNTLAGATETLESASDALATGTTGTETDLGDGLDSVLRYESEGATNLEADYATGSDRTEASTDGQADGDETPEQSADADVTSDDTVAADDGDSGGVLAGALARLGQFGEWLSDDVPASAAGVGALALAAAACRQWLTQTASSGAPTLLSSGLGGRVDGWLEKFWRVLLPAGYSRHDDSNPLDHDTRQALCEAIGSTPGIYLADLAERTGVPVSTVRYHVRVLAEEGVITTAKRRGKRRYYPAAADDVALADALSEPAKAAVLRALAEHGEAHVGLLADELDRDPSTVTHHLQALDDDGLVEREQRGRTVVNQLAGDVETALADAKPAPRDVPVSNSKATADDPADLPADD
jgi:DNA-binding transcriptional ArsR family regulator